MSFESITIPVEPEKENKTEIKGVKVTKMSKKAQKIFGKIIETSIDPHTKLILDYKDHPIFDGFVSAYKEHRPITISPDIIWILIVQAFSNFVSENHERLRSKFVNFEGKKELSVIHFGKVKSKDWQKSIFPEFVRKISEFTGQSIIDTLSPEFTTTTATSLAVGQISIMSTMKEYFDYELNVIGCGIPHITIEGSIEDWQKILAKLENLNSYDFKWFTVDIVPIINEIIQTKRGNVNNKFWKEMVRIKYGDDDIYDPSGVDGWFTKFFCYKNDGSLIYPPIQSSSDLQKELLEVPFKLNIFNGVKSQAFELKLLAGFVGLTQNKETGSLKPEIGWIIQN